MTESRRWWQCSADIGARFSGLDVLVLNASGGLERGADPGYRDAAQLRCAGAIGSAGASVDVRRRPNRLSSQATWRTSTAANRCPPTTLPIAVSKQAGEEALRGMIPTFEAEGVTLVTVSGDMIEASTMVRLFERRDPDAIAARRLASGGLPTVEEFAERDRARHRRPAPQWRHGLCRWIGLLGLGNRQLGVGSSVRFD